MFGALIKAQVFKARDSEFGALYLAHPPLTPPLEYPPTTRNGEVGETGEAQNHANRQHCAPLGRVCFDVPHTWFGGLGFRA
jgi:hypothetical protein